MAADEHGTWRQPNEWDDRWATEHVGRRVFARGQPMWHTIGMITLALAGPMAMAALLEPMALQVMLRVMVAPWAIVVVGLLIAGRATIRIMTDRVQIRWRGKHVVPRDAIAQVVSVGKRTFGLRRTGYIALVDVHGRPLWQSPSHIWSAQTIQALEGTGDRVIRIGRLNRAQARQYFPHLFRTDVRFLVKRTLLILLVLIAAFVVFFLVLSMVLFYS